MHLSHVFRAFLTKVQHQDAPDPLTPEGEDLQPAALKQEEEDPRPLPDEDPPPPNKARTTTTKTKTKQGRKMCEKASAIIIGQSVAQLPLQFDLALIVEL